MTFAFVSVRIFGQEQRPALQEPEGGEFTSIFCCGLFVEGWSDLNERSVIGVFAGYVHVGEQDPQTVF